MDRPLKLSTICRELGITDYRRRQLIVAGVLEPPIDLGGAYPLHTQSQLDRARRELEYRAKSSAVAAARPKTIKPLSRSLVAAIRGNFQHERKNASKRKKPEPKSSEVGRDGLGSY